MPKKHLDDLDDVKVELYVRHGSCYYIWFKANTALNNKSIISALKHDGATSGPGQFVVNDGTMNSTLYQRMLKENVNTWVHDLKHKCSWIYSM